MAIQRFWWPYWTPSWKKIFWGSDFGKLLICWKVHGNLSESMEKPFVAIFWGLNCIGPIWQRYRQSYVGSFFPFYFSWCICFDDLAAVGDGCQLLQSDPTKYLLTYYYTRNGHLVANITCHHGYRFLDNTRWQVLRCIDTSWSGTVPICLQASDRRKMRFFGRNLKFFFLVLLWINV